MSNKGIMGFVGTRHPKLYIHNDYLKLDGADEAAVPVLLGKGYATLTRNGAGDYTVTLTHPGRQILGVRVTPIAATPVFAVVQDDYTHSEINILLFDEDGVAADAEMFVEITSSNFASYTF